MFVLWKCFFLLAISKYVIFLIFSFDQIGYRLATFPGACKHFCTRFGATDATLVFPQFPAWLCPGFVDRKVEILSARIFDLDQGNYLLFNQKLFCLIDEHWTMYLLCS